MEQKNRSVIIDLMRLTGLILVTIFHLYDYKATYYGVLIFFVLSGYLITESLETREARYRDFLFNRVKKIYPPMMATILLSLLIYIFVNGHLTPNLVSTSVSTMLGVSNIHQIVNGISYFDNYSSDMLFKHTWALAIEIQFYVFFPLIIYICNKSKENSKKIKLIVLTILILLSQATMVYKLKTTADYTYLYYATETRIQSLLIGALCYYIPYNKLINNKLFSYIMMALMTIVFFACSFYFDYKSAFNYMGGIFLISVFISIFLVEVKKLNVVCDNFLLKKISVIGKHSYAYYLLQYPIMIFAREYFKWSDIDYSISVSMQIIILIVLAEIFYYIFEKGSNSMQLKKIIVLLIAYILTIFNSPIVRATEVEKLEEIIGLDDKFLAKHKNAVNIGEIPIEDDDYTEESENIEAEKTTDDSLEITEDENVSYDFENLDEIDLLEQRFLEDEKTVEENVEIPKEDRTEKKIEKVEQKEKNENVERLDKKEKKEEKKTEQKPVIDTHKSGAITFIGDSVMKMAENQLKKDFSGSYVDAKVSRQFVVLPDLLKSLEKQGHLKDIVIIHLGTNGVINKKAFDDTLAILKNRKVYFINCVVPKHWEKSVNSSINEWAKEYSNVKIIDWYKRAKGKRELFYNDATHLKPEGVKAYISLINENIK